MAVIIWSVLDAVDLLFLCQGKNFQFLNLAFDKIENHYTSFSLTIVLYSANYYKFWSIKDAL